VGHVLCKGPTVSVQAFVGTGASCYSHTASWQLVQGASPHPTRALQLITSVPPCRSQSHAPWHPPLLPKMDWPRLWLVLAEALPTLLEQEALPWFCLCSSSPSKAAVRAMHLAMISFLHTAKVHRALYGRHRPHLPGIRIGLAPYLIFFGLPGLGTGWGQAPASLFRRDFMQSSSEYQTVQPTASLLET